MWKIYSQKSIDRLKKEAGEQAVAEYKANEEKKPEHYMGLVDSLREQCRAMLKFDNPHVSVFSIERMDMGDARERTIVGYVFTGEATPQIS